MSNLSYSQYQMQHAKVTIRCCRCNSEVDFDTDRPSQIVRCNCGREWYWYLTIYGWGPNHEQVEQLKEAEGE